MTSYLDLNMKPGQKEGIVFGEVNCQKKAPFSKYFVTTKLFDSKIGTETASLLGELDKQGGVICLDNYKLTRIEMTNILGESGALIVLENSLSDDFKKMDLEFHLLSFDAFHERLNSKDTFKKLTREITIGDFLIPIYNFSSL